MSRASSVKIGAHWSKPPTKIYDSNYNFQEGYYKPMVEYINKRDRGITDEPPGARTLAERIAANRADSKNRDPQISFSPYFNFVGEPRGMEPPEMVMSADAAFGDEDPFTRPRRRNRSRLTPELEGVAQAEEMLARAASVGASPRKAAAELESMMLDMGRSRETGRSRTEERSESALTKSIETSERRRNFNLDTIEERRQTML